LGTAVFRITVVPLLYLISLFPFPILYLFSDALFVIAYLVFGYRKKVVTLNLERAFPEMSPQERNRIRRKFYRHFCDVIFETIKLLTIKPETFRNRCVMDRECIATFNRFIERNQSVIGVMGHCGNWEWGAIAHQLYFTRMITGVYHPLSNKGFDRLMLDLRSRFGGDIVAMNHLYKRLLSLRQQNVSTTVGLIADQSPAPESAYWTTFLNQDTPVFNGPEKLARKFNNPVIYLKVMKTGRGRYTLSATVLTETPLELDEGKISELHTRALEANIREQPHCWLWSHRRWKHVRMGKKSV
jgi:Kdo2-lipid IVA lauroyltransferase/acyltransferase